MKLATSLLAGIIINIIVVFLAYYSIIPHIVGQYAGAMLIVVSVAFAVVCLI